MYETPRLLLDQAMLTQYGEFYYTRAFISIHRFEILHFSSTFAQPEMRMMESADIYIVFCYMMLVILL